jgi:hypothetical protein
MRSSRFRLAGMLLVAACVSIAACRQSPQPAAAPSSAPQAATAPAAPAAAAAATPATKPADALASHRTDWPDVIADVTEFRRKGNTLTAVIRLRNLGVNTAVVGISYAQSYLLDEANAKKYQVLTDDNNGEIAGPIGAQGVTTGSAMMFWMKFPAPPSEVRTATLVITSVVPFEGLPIQEQ